MNRRSFLKALGLGSGATAVAGCGLDDNRYYTPVEKALPYVTHPIQTTPGNPSYFATSIGTGPRAWPVTAVHREGRVVNVGANQVAHAKGNLARDGRTELRAPRAVPSAQLFDLQRHYSPDRLSGPRENSGEHDHADISWEDALTKVTEAAKAAVADGKRIAYLGPYTSGVLPFLLQQITTPAPVPAEEGGDPVAPEPNAVFWEALGLEAEALAAEALLGSRQLPRYDLANARYVLSFGAPFLGDAWGSAGHRAAFARGKDANHGHFVTRFAAVTPMRDQTAANADEWYACNPGTEAQVALAIAKYVARERSYEGSGAALTDLGDIATAAHDSGLSEAQIEEMAKRFASGGAVAIPGGINGASERGTQLAVATYLLNIVSGGGTLFTSGGYPGPVHSYGEVESLMADMSSGKIGLLLLGDLDAVHLLPGSESFLKALHNVPLSVALTSFPSATTAAANLVLPTHSVFEDWGDEEPEQGLHLVRQPSMRPLGDTRSLGDIALDIWRAIDDAAPQGSWRDYLMARWSADVFDPFVRNVGVLATEGEPAPRDPVPPAPSDAFRRWWEGVLSDGFFVTQSSQMPLFPVNAPQLERSAATMAGSGDYHLMVFAHSMVLDGRYANEPWAQETPDPMSGHVWDTYVLVHPDTAAKLGVSDNHQLQLTTEAGTVDVGVEVHPCVKPNVLAVPLGGGHESDKGRYADGVGVNVVAALTARKDRFGALAWQQARCTAKATGRSSDLHSTFGVYPRDYVAGTNNDTNESDADRNFVALVSASEWAKQGDAPTKHPGELTGIHHLPMDSRLLESGKAKDTVFYLPPSHPTYRFAMVVDTNACTGCGACAVACYAENNLPVVGKEKVKQGREMNWIRVNRYFKQHNADASSPSVHFVPMMCQQCGHAPCESVCPVLATYHTIDGLNAMVYNRCVGTRYCSNACPYSARKFNYHTYVWPEPFNLQLNPDVVTRTMGVMEKCTFCVQRLRRTKSAYRDRGYDREVPEPALEQVTACAEACPSQAISFGNENRDESAPAKAKESGRSYVPLAELNTFPAVTYMARASYHFEPGHGGGHADEHDSTPHHDAAPHGADGH